MKFLIPIAKFILKLALSIAIETAKKDAVRLAVAKAAEAYKDFDSKKVREQKLETATNIVKAELAAQGKKISTKEVHFLVTSALNNYLK